jgi:hypothetical protein
MSYTYTSQQQIRTAFWAMHADLPRRRIPDHSGGGTMYPTETRCAFVDFVDALERGGDISSTLAERVTL